MRELELLGTLGCHLCEVAAGVLMTELDPQKYEVYQVDIAEDEQLMERYALTIPVLLDVSSQQVLNWPFDVEQLRQFLAELPDQS